MLDIPLHDIKPLIEVPDNSLLVLLSIIVASLVIIGLLVWAWFAFKKSKELNLRKEYLKQIHNINMKDAKLAAYEISKYARLLASTDKEKALLKNLDLRLEQYKYKKEVEGIDTETKGHFEVFLEVLDES